MSTSNTDAIPKNEAALEKQKASNLREVGLRLLARANLPMILADHPFDHFDWTERSPIELPEDLIEHQWRELLWNLPKSDNIWIGHLNETGDPCFANRFRTVKDWLQTESRCPGPFICPAHFKPGAYQRSNANIIQNRFLIVESDTLTKDEVSSVFLWLGESWHFVAVVDTGNKSLHGWFQIPPDLKPGQLADAKIVLEGLGCDGAMFKPAQATRLPGWVREDTHHYQTLLYLDHMAAV